MPRAVALRNAGFGGEIVLVGAEPHDPYDRPPLSKQLLVGDSEHGDIVLAGARKLAELGVRVRLGSAATRLDVEGRRSSSPTARASTTTA